MPYDRYQTPEMARRQRAYEWMCVLALGVIVACVLGAAALVVAMLS